MRTITVRATKRLLLGIVAAAVLAAFPQLARAQAPGALTQLAGANSCIETTQSTGECPTSGTGMTGSVGVAVSPDGKNVYVIGSQDDSIAEFARNADGSLTAELAQRLHRKRTAGRHDQQQQLREHDRDRPPRTAGDRDQPRRVERLRRCNR